MQHESPVRSGPNKFAFAGRLLGAMLPLLCSATSSSADTHEDPAYEIVEGLTSEVGPRLAGTEAEARGREWAVRKLTALGFSNVRIEPFDVPTWVRGEERAQIVAPYQQQLALTALGGSAATATDGITGEVVGFASIDALRAAPESAIRGKIVYVSHSMRPTQDGSSYEFFGPVRVHAPSIAAKKGAMGIVVRSLGTDSHRAPHTGGTSWDGVAPIPSAALSNPDADNLERMLSRATSPVRLHLQLTPRTLGLRPSGNVIAEVTGTDPAAGLIAIGGHLDSWDLGTGAIDDGSGLAVTTAAASAFLHGQKPRRTIRLVWWGAEEMGPFGARAYFNAHKHEPHALVAEADFGADRVWLLRTKLPPTAKPIDDRLIAALAPLGIGADGTNTIEGEDIAQFIESGVSGVYLAQDLGRYFDFHHTPDDTLDKIDPAQLRQCVQAWTQMLEIVANAPEDLLPRAAAVR